MKEFLANHSTYSTITTLYWVPMRSTSLIQGDGTDGSDTHMESLKLINWYNHVTGLLKGC